MKRRGIFARVALAGLLALAAAPAAGDAATLVKLATLVPEGSVWDKILRQMGAEWSAGSDGRVRLRIYPGGVAGDEPDVVRKMRIGQLHAAALTVGGLTEIDDAFTVFEIPLFFDSVAEVREVLATLQPMLAARLEAKGFVLLHWGYAGWVHMFSTAPLATPDDLRRLKLFVWAGNNRMVQWWQSNGYRPVPLASTDILPALKTGMLEALPVTPLAALSLQWYRETPHMLAPGVVPLVGATVLTRRAWEGIGAADREALLAAAAVAEAQLFAQVPEQDRQAVVEMEKRGLAVERVAGERLAPWQEVAEGFAATMRGQIVPPEVFDQARRARDAFRDGAVGGGGEP